ncbi:hypothetical protein ABZ826_31445 [Streptomyces sp. NPDC047515]|uniref:hypothetical protein n=1 Tax=Streptomyces sp. NPDC047515 TaxID=3155380 RepID=UPI0033CEF353
MEHAESSVGPRPLLCADADADADDSDIAELAPWRLGIEPKSKILAPVSVDLEAWQPMNWSGRSRLRYRGPALTVVSALKGMRQASTEVALADPSPCAHRRHPRPGADPHS